MCNFFVNLQFFFTSKNHLTSFNAQNDFKMIALLQTLARWRQLKMYKVHIFQEKKSLGGSGRQVQLIFCVVIKVA